MARSRQPADGTPRGGASRSPVKPINLSADAVKIAADAEKARKRASRAALKSSKAEAALSSDAAKTEPTPEAPAIVEPRLDLNAISAADLSDTLLAQRVDYEAELEAGNIAEGVTFDAYLADQGFTLEGEPIDEKRRCDGPMLPLVAARRSYIKAANGILCNGDGLAELCGHYERPIVVTGLIAALKLPGNPYLHLNAGQQSMNLRNKARRQLKDGLITMAEVAAALQWAFEAKQIKA